MKKIIFITTYKARDFEGNALIGYYLLKNFGIETIYTSGYNIVNKIYSHKPVAIIFDHLTWNHKVELLKECQKMGLKTIYYPTEGYYKDMTSFDPGIGLRYVKNPNMSKYLLWGSDMMDRVKAIKIFDKELGLFKISGPARFDYYTNPKLANLVESKQSFCEKYNIKPETKIITYMSTNPYQGYEFSEFRRRYKKNAGYPDNEIIAHFEDQKKLFINHVSLIQKLAIELGEGYFFFFKTHPAETYLSNYDEYFNGINNIKLIYNADVKPFLFNSDIVLQRNCTTAVESWMLGKLVIQIDDDHYLNATYEEHYTNSVICTNKNELVNAIEKSYENNNKHNYLTNEFLIRKFYLMDGKSFERIGTEIGNLINSISDLELHTISKLISDHQEINDKQIQNKLKDFLGINRTTTINPINILKKFKNRRKNLHKNVKNETDISQSDAIEMYDKFKSINI